MVSSLIPLKKGFIYQSFYFWKKALELLDDSSEIKSVSFELDEAKSFDDAKHKAQNQLHTFTNEDLLCLSTKAISAMDENKTTHEYC